MKLLYTLIFSGILLCFAKDACADAGIYNSYVILDINATGNQYRYGTKNDDVTNAAFQGSNFGSVNSIFLKGGQLKSFKSSADVTAANMAYRVYKVGSTPGAFITLGFDFGQDYGSGNQRWEKNNYNINLASGLPSATYTLEVYFFINSTVGDRYDSNGGANYTATFTVTSATLPVTLSSFNAKANNHMASLDWATASESGNAYFDVERSLDAQAFTRVGRVEGRGTTAARQIYTFTDESPSRGTNYYRLRQVDANGQFALSQVRAVLIRSNGELTILGNPATEQFAVTGLEAGSTVDLLDLNGQLRRRQATTDSRLQIDVRDLPSGTYLLRVAEPTGTQTKRVMVMR
ncbi:T9SS type A sorting domain-containing protein [Fibrella aquatilis]|uniref:T9SS type A sorting domain-containing protein n=1 Tax=Fibrella aquatilis TaxID=2817059 RepID=A0A939K160_9BACT|nr:T9SS type A sorting domain-containing protein [Fibrella aquatilis]MBO0932711.1 T9SS type A sorting domain-containing protein [Fibrella aquatilis]